MKGDVVVSQLSRDVRRVSKANLPDEGCESVVARTRSKYASVVDRACDIGQVIDCDLLRDIAAEKSRLVNH